MSLSPALPNPRRQRVLPGFGLSLGYTLVYLSLVVLVPLSAVFLKTASLSFEAFWQIVTAPRVLASYQLSFGASLAAAAINTVFGLLLAWTLVRYRFPGKKIVDALIDLPFALPTAVAGIALSAVYARNGWVGAWLDPVWNSFVHWLADALPWVNWTSVLGDKLAPSSDLHMGRAGLSSPRDTQRGLTCFFLQEVDDPTSLHVESAAGAELCVHFITNER